MNRRQFLASLGIGAPAAVVAAKVGLFERVRKYFFAPKQGWHLEPAAAQRPGCYRLSPTVQLQLEVYERQILRALHRDSVLFDKFSRLDDFHAEEARAYLRVLDVNPLTNTITLAS